MKYGCTCGLPQGLWRRSQPKATVPKPKWLYQSAADPATPLRHSGEALAFKIRHDAMRKKGTSLLNSASALVGSSVRRISGIGSSRKTSSSCTMDPNPGYPTELYRKDSNEPFDNSPVRKNERPNSNRYPLPLPLPLPLTFCLCPCSALCLNEP